MTQRVGARLAPARLLATERSEAESKRNTHYERVACSVFRQARHLDNKGLSGKAQSDIGGSRETFFLCSSKIR
jgi:hypothetical protein